MPAHKCGHGKRCVPVYDPEHCIPCRAALEGMADAHSIPCVFCSLTPRKIDCYTPDFARGGCLACGMPGGDAAGKGPVDVAVVAEIRAQAVDVFAAARAS